MHTLLLGLALLVLALALACQPGLTAPSRGARATAAGSGLAAASSEGGAPLSAASGWSFGGGGAGGTGDDSASVGAGGAQPTGSASAGATGGGAPCTPVVIAEVRTRGANGASDEFVGLFNASDAAVTLDTSFAVVVRGASNATFRTHWTGSGGVIPPFGRYLLAGGTYAQAPAPDETLSVGITDAAAVRLTRGGATVDELCFGYDETTMAAFDASFACPGVASNLPHNNTSTAASDVDASLARSLGPALASCADRETANAFTNQAPSTPASSVSSPEAGPP